MSLCECGCGKETKIRRGKSSRFISGHNSSMLGKHHSEETKNKMRRPKSEEHKKHLSDACKGRISSMKGVKRFDIMGDNNPAKRPEVRNKISDALSGRKLTPEWIEKLSGENASNWQGGKSFEPYCSKFNNKKKEEIRNQYNRKCYLCEKDEKYNIMKSNGKIRKLSVHHIDLDKEQGCNGKSFKLIPLCTNCHEMIHHSKNKQELNDMILNKLKGEY